MPSTSAARQSIPLEVLVGRAGQAVALAALDLLGGAYGRRVVVVAGRGNNGADGRVAARFLAGRGARVVVVEAGPDVTVGPVDLVIDAAYGTGFRGEYQAPAVPPGAPVLAVDIPSGIEGDTGAAAGSPMAGRPHRDLRGPQARPGPGGRGPTGRPGVRGRHRAARRAGPPSRSWRTATWPSCCRPGVTDGNKWSAAVLVVAGSPGMTGAAALCARSAYRSGAGMVRLGVPGAALSESPASEAVSVELPATGWSTRRPRGRRALPGGGGRTGVGPGPGGGPGGQAVGGRVAGAGGGGRRRALRPGRVPGRLAAGGGLRASCSPLTTASTPASWARPRVPTGSPPPGGWPGASGAVALLKGPTTAVADPDGRVLLGTAGTPKLATAGTGDVLSGVIGAMLARGVAPLEAAALAAHVHGRAGALGPAEGLVAGDLPELVSPGAVRSPGPDRVRRGSEGDTRG